MARKPEKEVVKWLSVEELDREIRSRKIEAVVLRKLLFIRSLYSGKSEPQAAEEVGISKVIGYTWLDEWNEKGLEGLKPSYGGGRPPELSEEQREELKILLKERDDWTTREIRDLIKDRFGVEYSIRHVSRVLSSLGMRHAKPYPHDHRRPEDAKEDLKKT